MGGFSIIAAADMGSSTFRVAAGLFDRAGRLKRLALGRSPSRGIFRGMVTDLGEAARSLSTARQAAADQLGFSINSAWVGVSGGRVTSLAAEGRVPVLGQGHEIDELDLQRAIVTAEVQAVGPESEALHVLPAAFAVDGHWGIRNPLGMYGHELWVRAVVITSDLVHTQNLLRAARQAGLRVNGLVAASLAAATSSLTAAEKLEGAVLIDIGADCSNVLAFAERRVVRAFTVPIAGALFDRDLSYGLHVSPGEAQQLRVARGGIPATGGDRGGLMATIIGARAEELFEYVLDGLRDIRVRSAVLVGGMSQSAGIPEAAGHVLGIPCRLAECPFAEQPFEPEDLGVLGVFSWAAAQREWPSNDSGWLEGLRGKLRSGLNWSWGRTPQ